MAVQSKLNSQTNNSTGFCPTVTIDDIKEGFQRSHVSYDRNGEEHYNIISALHKSVRGSDENAALYWLGRMLVGGEEPLYIARRLVRMASEDIGKLKSGCFCTRLGSAFLRNAVFVTRSPKFYLSKTVGLADPLALNQTVSAFQACHFIGRPECDVSGFNVVV